MKQWVVYVRICAHYFEKPVVLTLGASGPAAAAAKGINEALKRRRAATIRTRPTHYAVSVERAIGQSKGEGA